MLGVLDFGIGFWDQVQVGNAARAGAEYAQRYFSTNGFDASKIQNAVTNATALTVQATPAPTQGCFCATPSGLNALTCRANCAGGGNSATYITVNANASYSTIFAWPGLSSPVTLTSSYTVRVD